MYTWLVDRGGSGGGAETEGVRAEAQVENSKGIALILSSRAARPSHMHVLACRRAAAAEGEINAIPLESSTSFLDEEELKKPDRQAANH